MLRRILEIVAVILWILLAKRGWGSETDNVTYRFVQLEDSAAKLDRIFNAYLTSIMESTNATITRSASDPKSISDTAVEVAFVKTYVKVILPDPDHRLVPIFEACIERNNCQGWPHFERIYLGRDESIYGEVHYGEVAVAFLSSTLNMCGSRIGTDKITHIIGDGFLYYNASRNKKSPIYNEEDVYRTAMADERGLMGARSTNVISSADAEANRAGFKLATSYLSGSKSIFARDSATGLLKKQNDVHFCDYVSDQMDEVIHPPSYTHHKRKVSQLLAAIADRRSFNSWADSNMSAESKQRFHDEIVRRPMDRRHDHISPFRKFLLATKDVFIYFTMPKDSRRAIGYLISPKVALSGRKDFEIPRSTEIQTKSGQCRSEASGCPPLQE
jgi:hypothetical protein